MPGFWHTGAADVQFAVVPAPALAVQLGVVHAPVVVLQTWPESHCGSSVHWTTSVAELTVPALLAVMVLEPRGRLPEGTQDQVPSDSTVAVQMVKPLTATVTLCPGMPVPAMDESSCWVFALPPDGGEVRPTAGLTHWCPVVLYTWPAPQGAHSACAVLALLHTGVEAEQSAVDPEPALPRHNGVVQPPDVT
jgi:hypothetical protein